MSLSIVNYCSFRVGAVTLSLASLLAPAWAESQVAVLPKDFSCILQHKQDYRAQGDIITLNFETCPERPSFSERLEAHQARNVFPSREVKKDSEVAVSGPKITASMLVTKEEFECLIRYTDLIERDEDSGRLLILPNHCQEIAQ